MSQAVQETARYNIWCIYKLKPFLYEYHNYKMLWSRLKWNVAEPSEKKQNIIRKKNQLLAEQLDEFVSNGEVWITPFRWVSVLHSLEHAVD